MKALDFYSSQSILTDPGRYKNLLDSLPSSIRELCNIVHGLIIHRDSTSTLYKFKASLKEKSEADNRYIEKIISEILKKDDSALSKSRPPKNRFFGTCRDFSTLLVSFLRHKKFPSRLRYGFATYFKKGWYEDHALCEYWNREKNRWILVDPQLGDVEIEYDKIDFDNTDVSVDKFLTSGIAWQLIRKGKGDANKFGVPWMDIKGAWFVRASVLRDLASLNKVELLPWDYTEFSDKNFDDISDLDKKDISLIDKIAEITSDSSAGSFEKIQSIYNSVPKLQAKGKIISYTVKGQKHVFI